MPEFRAGQTSRSQICLSAVGASDYALIPVEANVKGVNSLVDTLDFLNEQAELEAFTESVLGIVPFRDRWVGNTQTLSWRQNIAAMKEFAGDVPILASIRKSEKVKNAIRQGQLLSDLAQVVEQASQKHDHRQQLASRKRAEAIISKFGRNA